MIPELSVLENMEEIKIIWNDTVIHPYHNILCNKEYEKKRILASASMVKKQNLSSQIMVIKCEVYLLLC